MATDQRNRETEFLSKLETLKDLRSKTLQLEKVRTKLGHEIASSENEERCVEDYRQEMELLLQEKMAHVEELTAQSKTLQLEKVRTKLGHEIVSSENEERCVEDYSKEMELLLQEKMAHVEELRLIHADINLMETTIKQAEEARNRSRETAKFLFEELGTLKDQVDSGRVCLGLERLPQEGGDDERVKQELFEKKSTDWPIEPPEPSIPQTLVAAAVAAQQTIQPSTVKCADRQTSFRQQPPPMKACLSCHQQIHRNAPICPLCKAKSRSRNPKKPKRKHDE